MSIHAEVEYRNKSKCTDLIEIHRITIDTCDGYGIVSVYLGYRHADGTTNLYPSAISGCGYCNSIICSIERAKQIYDRELKFYDNVYNLQ